MRFKYLAVLLFCSFLFENTYSQDTLQNTNVDTMSVGIGFGLDYGGTGVNVSYYPISNVGMYCGVGYAYSASAYTLGINYRLLSKNIQSNIFPIYSVMWGYNAAVLVKNRADLNKHFYGFSTGVGIDYHFVPRNYIAFRILYRFEDESVADYIQELKDTYGLDFKEHLIPLSFTVAYRFSID